MAASSTAGTSISCSHPVPARQSVRCEKVYDPGLAYHNILTNNVPPPTPRPATDNSYTTLRPAYRDNLK